MSVGRKSARGEGGVVFRRMRKIWLPAKLKSEGETFEFGEEG